MLRCLLVRLLSARCCCVTAVELALPWLWLALLGQAPESQPGRAARVLAPESQPGRAASAIPRGLQPKDAPS